MKPKIAIIGGGAAGCFCAVNLKDWCPDAEVTVIEAQNRPLAKVAITGGGRCNLTNSFRDITQLGQAYPRGERLMKRMLNEFSPVQTMQWWEQHGVALMTQEDQCVFPKSQDAMQIVSTLTEAMEETGVRLWTDCRVNRIDTSPEDSTNPIYSTDFVVITTGGSPRPEGLDFLSPLALETASPVPSLFTMNIPDKGLRSLMGVVVENASLSLAGSRFSASGPLLITHWGVSGPATLRLSSYAARHLAERGYKATLLVNWMYPYNQERVHSILQELQQEAAQKLISNRYPTQLTARLWGYLTSKAGISAESRWSALGKKQMNRLVALLTSDEYPIEGQSRFREEFVTCGGVSLSNIHQNTLECKHLPGLYLAGEVLDADAITGGFNLQAAWSMGYVCAKSIAEKIKSGKNMTQVSPKFHIFAKKR